MDNRQNDAYEEEIDLLDIGRVLLHRLKMLILFIVLGAAAAFSCTYVFVTPLYTASTLMYVNNSTFSVGSTSVSFSASELTAAQSLVDTYSVILKSRMTLEDVIDQADLSYTYEELYEMVESKAVNSTEIFEIAVTSSSPVEAEHIANTIAEILPGKIADVVDGSDVRIVDYAVIPSERVSPSYTKNTAIGALVGLLIAAAWVILRYLLDDYIRTEDYLTATYPNVPLLAVIPLIEPGTGRPSSNGYYRKQPVPAQSGRKKPDAKAASARSNQDTKTSGSNKNAEKDRANTAREPGKTKTAPEWNSTNSRDSRTQERSGYRQAVQDGDPRRSQKTGERNRSGFDDWESGWDRDWDIESDLKTLLTKSGSKTGNETEGED